MVDVYVCAQGLDVCINLRKTPNNNQKLRWNLHNFGVECGKNDSPEGYF